jgi:hypothetical protein
LVLAGGTQLTFVETIGLVKGTGFSGSGCVCLKVGESALLNYAATTGLATGGAKGIGDFSGSNYASFAANAFAFAIGFDLGGGFSCIGALCKIGDFAAAFGGDRRCGDSLSIPIRYASLATDR